MKSEPPVASPNAGPDHTGLTALRPLWIGAAGFALMLAWLYLAYFSRNDPWYRNVDPNVPNLVDALAINSDQVPVRIEQPGFVPKYLLALDYRVRHYAGVLPVWNLKKFSASLDPLGVIRTLIMIGRMQSRVLVMLFILSAASLAYAVLRRIETACLAVILLCGSAGLLFHGLLTRPELLCAWLGGVAALWCTWHGVASQHWLRQHCWLFLAGICVGLATLTQLQGMFYLLPCLAWGWLFASLANEAETPSSTAQIDLVLLGGLLPAASAMALLWLAHLAFRDHAGLGLLAVQRLRIAAMLVGILPLIDLGVSRPRSGGFLLRRGREFALLGGGALAAVPLAYLAMRSVMSGPRALEYVSGLLNLCFDPAPFLKDFLAPKPDVARECFRFFRDAPFLFLFACAGTVGVLLARTIPARLKAFIVLLFVSALALTLLLGQGHFLTQFGIFPQVPLLLLCALSGTALARRWTERNPIEPGGSWTGSVILTAALVLVLTVGLRLHNRYSSFQPDGGRPIASLTVTLLYEHTAYPQAYLKTMAAHYGDRRHFVDWLEHYVDDPANRD